MAQERSNPERVLDVLRAASGSWTCDDCVAELADVKNRTAVNPITSAFGLTSDFAREKGACSRCREHKLVTRTVPK